MRGDAGGARDHILGRIREALAERERAGREPVAHPGPVDRTASAPAPEADAEATTKVDALAARLEASGVEVVRLEGPGAARRWLADFASGFESAAVSPELRGRTGGLRPDLPAADPAEAELAVSVALGAAAQTGSLLLSSREGRRLQVLAPTHLVWVDATDVHATLDEALAAVKDDLPALLALHSGPSKSADIGQIMVTGVHGPGRLVAAVVDGGS